jgi:DNA-directed RNA polymerase II subunit RPB1
MAPTQQIFYAEDVLGILKRINEEDAEILGFSKDLNRPDWIICTVFSVPPPAVRPSVRNDTGQRSEDDLTHKLCDIVKTNNTLKQKIEKGANKEQIEYWYMLLQYHISTFVDNQIPGVAPAKQRTGRPLRSVRERLKSKEGRIRGNLMGKRVDFSARSVITPDPNISIDELGVPYKIAMNLTFPEVVTPYNKEALTKLVHNGPDVYPGAKYWRIADQKHMTKQLKNMDRNSIVLKEGDIVDRHLHNGDYVLFNRQPSLHKMSMMAHKVRVMPYDTFRLNVCTTPGYNADFDGDEMNMHVPQSLQTENELIQLASVPTQIISPRDGSPIISVVQDIALGVYRLTKDHVFLTEKQIFNLLSVNSRFAGEVPRPLSAPSDASSARWSGKQLLSSIMPHNLNITMGNKGFDPSKQGGDQSNFVVIENGEIKQGVVDKSVYQARTNGIVHSVFNDSGNEEARHVFDNTQKIICNWLVNNGFSVGVSDLVIAKEGLTNIKQLIHDKKVQTYDIIHKIHMNTLDNDTIKSNHEFFEELVNNILNETTNKVGKIGSSSMSRDNRLIDMISSGSKGNIINVAQMVASLGQQNVDGKRIPYGFDDRTLPHYTKFDDGPESRGFVENSFIKGLSPQEFFFHAMGGREGLIDKLLVNNREREKRATP